MKKHIKGFTLIECIVALAILGIASLTMAQIYARVSAKNRDNHMINSSLSNQMAYVEEATGNEAVGVFYGGAEDYDDHIASEQPPHIYSTGTNNNYLTIQKVQDDGSGNYTDVAGEVYTFPIDIYVLKSRDGNNKTSGDSGYVGQPEDQYNLRYKYVLGH